MLLCDGYCMNDEYLHNEWVVRIQGGPRLAKRIARDFGYSYHGPVSCFGNLIITGLVEIYH